MLYSRNDTIARELRAEARQKYSEGDRETARRKLTAALQLDPESEYTRFNLAYMDWKEGHLDRAIQTLKPLSVSAVDASIRAESLICLSDACYEGENLDAAFEFSARVLGVDLSPDDPHAGRITADGHCGMGMVEKARGNLERAEAHLKECLYVHPNHACGHSHLAHCYYLMDDFAKAIEHGRRAIELGEESPDDNPIGNEWLHLGWYYEESGVVDHARACFARAIELGEEEAVESIEELNASGGGA